MKPIREINHLPKIGAFQNALVYDNVDLCKANFYYYDSCGQYLKLPFNCPGSIEETITMFEDLVADGNLIGTYTNEAGEQFQIKETVTGIVDNGDGTATFTGEDGVPHTFNTSGDSIVDNGDGTYLVTKVDGSTFTIDTNETNTSIVDNGNGSFNYTNEAGVTVTIPCGISCASIFPNQPGDCGPSGEAALIEDANGNVTVLNVNGNIPLASTGNAGYVTSGELVIPGAKLEVASINSTAFVHVVPNPTSFTNSAELITQVVTNSTSKNRIYNLSLYGIEFATTCQQGQVGHTLEITGSIIANLYSSNKGNSGAPGNLDNVQTIYHSIVLMPGQSVTLMAKYRWQNMSIGAPSLTFNGARLELIVTSYGMEQ